MPTKKILLVDDDENILTVLKMRLEIMGFEVTACNNPIKALQLFKEEKFRFLDVFCGFDIWWYQIHRKQYEVIWDEWA